MDKIERRLRNLELSTFGRSGNSWHSRGELSDGTKTGTIGAMTYIVDDDGFPLSEGYHSIEVVVPHYQYTGRSGAMREIIRNFVLIFTCLRIGHSKRWGGQ